jgi:hypothetical protein
VACCALTGLRDATIIFDEWGNLFMRLGKALVIVFSSIVLSAGASFAGANKSTSGKGDHPPQKSAGVSLAGTSKSTSGKGDHPPQKSPPAPVQHAKPQAPIVMGRSITVRRKSKMHHVKAKPSESDGLHEDSEL